jgi:hypothetical protein
MKIYFAGAIRGGRDDHALHLQIIERLREYGEVLTEHVGDSRLDALGEAGSGGVKVRAYGGAAELKPIFEEFFCGAHAA